MQPHNAICSNLSADTKHVLSHSSVISHPPEARGLCFAQYFCIYFLSVGAGPQTGGGYGNPPGYLVIGELGMHGPPAGGCLANNVR